MTIGIAVYLYLNIPFSFCYLAFSVLLNATLTTLKPGEIRHDMNHKESKNMRRMGESNYIASDQVLLINVRWGPSASQFNHTGWIQSDWER